METQMGTQVVELTAEQLQKLIDAVSYNSALVVLCGFLLAFEIGAIVFWLTIFRE